MRFSKNSYSTAMCTMARSEGQRDKSTLCCKNLQDQGDSLCLPLAELKLHKKCGNGPCFGVHGAEESLLLLRSHHGTSSNSAKARVQRVNVNENGWLEAAPAIAEHGQSNVRGRGQAQCRLCYTMTGGCLRRSKEGMHGVHQAQPHAISPPDYHAAMLQQYYGTTVPQAKMNLNVGRWQGTQTLETPKRTESNIVAIHLVVGMQSPRELSDSASGGDGG